VSAPIVANGRTVRPVEIDRIEEPTDRNARNREETAPKDRIVPTGLIAIVRHAAWTAIVTTDPKEIVLVHRSAEWIATGEIDLTDRCEIATNEQYVPRRTMTAIQEIGIVDRAEAVIVNEHRPEIVHLRLIETADRASTDVREIAIAPSETVAQRRPIEIVLATSVRLRRPNARIVTDRLRRPNVRTVTGPEIVSTAIVIGIGTESFRDLDVGTKRIKENH
jgi:hypothetical protein